MSSSLSGSCLTGPWEKDVSRTVLPAANSMNLVVAGSCGEWALQDVFGPFCLRSSQ